MDYNQTLQWLQNLIGTQQGINTNEFGQSLSAQQKALADTLANQRAMQGAGLTEQGREFDVSSALQKVIADWQNQLAGRQQTQSEQGQTFNQNLTTKQTSLPYQMDQNLMAIRSSPAGQESTANFLNNLLSRISQNSRVYAGNGSSYDPYSRNMISSVGIPTIWSLSPKQIPANP